MLIFRTYVSVQMVAFCFVCLQTALLGFANCASRICKLRF